MTKEQKDEVFLSNSRELQGYCNTFNDKQRIIDPQDLFQETYLAFISSSYVEGDKTPLEYMKYLAKKQYLTAIREYKHQNDKDTCAPEGRVQTPEDEFNFKQLRGLINEDFWRYVNPKESVQKRTFVNLKLLGYDNSQIMDKLEIDDNRFRTLREALIPRLQEYIKMVNK